MTLKEFAAQVKEESPFIDDCYVAVVPNLNDDGSETYHLEVEIEPGSVLAGTFDTGVEALDGDELLLRMARDEADELQGHLEKLGLFVYKAESSWHASRDDEDEGDHEAGGEG